MNSTTRHFPSDVRVLVCAPTRARLAPVGDASLRGVGIGSPEEFHDVVASIRPKLLNDLGGDSSRCWATTVPRSGLALRYRSAVHQPWGDKPRRL